MKIIILLNILLTFLCNLKEGSATCDEDNNEPWSYHGKNNGPSKWEDTYPQCNGDSQSPINFRYKDVSKGSNVNPLKMTNYDRNIKKAEIINTGHTVIITPKDNIDRTILVNGVTFKLIQLHFHWGSCKYKGSEHLFNYRAYSMEGHFVHINDDGGIAVFGVLYDEIPWKNNTGFKAIAEVLPQIRFKDEETDLSSPIILPNLVPKLPPAILRYSGSLTTPNCTEGVTWSVAINVGTIGEKQLNEFRSLFSVTKDDDNDGCNLQDNFRPVQPLNGRDVTI